MTKKSGFYYSSMAAGISLIIMAILAAFSYGYVFGGIVLFDEPSKTLNNLLAAKGLFVFGTIGWIGIIITDLIVTFSLYSFFKGISKRWALIGGIARLAYTIILSVAVFKLGQVSNLVAGATTGTSELAKQIMDLFISFDSIWSFALIIFGIHLMVIGYVAYQSRRIPKLISILVIIAGISYALINLMYGFLPQLDSITSVVETILVLPMTIGELGLGFWLLIKGRKLESV